MSIAYRHAKKNETKEKLNYQRGTMLYIHGRGIIWRGTRDDTDQRWAKGSRCMANIMQSSACNDRGTMAGRAKCFSSSFSSDGFSVARDTT